MESQVLCLCFKEIQSSERWQTLSIISILKTYWEHTKELIQQQNTSQTALVKVWKKIKADFPEADELEEVVRTQANEWKILSFTKKV